MIKLMVVAGDDTEALVKYLDRRGALSIEKSYNTLSVGYKDIRDSLIKVDKLVYIMQNNNVNLTSEMSILNSLLQDNAFFKVQEIVLFIKESEYTLKGLKYFMSVMEECQYTSYSVKKVQSLAFTLIFDELLGKTNSDRIKTKYNNIYRVERGVDSKKAYDIEEDDDLVVEPFSYKRISDFDKLKEVSVRSETGITVKDDPSQDIQQYDNLVIGRLNTKEVVLVKDTFIFTGLNKSGSSMYCSSAMTSAMSAGDKVLVLDLSSTKGSAYLSKKFGNSCLMTDIKDVLLNTYVYDDYRCIVVQDDYKLSKHAKFAYLKYILSLLPKINPSKVFIDCDYDDLKTIISLCKTRVNTVFIAMQVFKGDAEYLSLDVNSIARSHKVMILLNDNVTGLDVGNRLLATDVKGYFPSIKIFKPIDIPDFSLDGTLNTVLLEG